MMAKRAQILWGAAVISAGSVLGCALDSDVEDESVGTDAQEVYYGYVLTVGEEADHGLLSLPNTTCSAVALTSRWGLAAASCGDLTGQTVRFQLRNYTITGSYSHPHYSHRPPQYPPTLYLGYNLQVIRLNSDLLDYGGGLWSPDFLTTTQVTASSLVGDTLRCVGKSPIATYGTFTGGSAASGRLSLVSSSEYLQTMDRGGPCFTNPDSFFPIMVAINVSGYSSQPAQGSTTHGGYVLPITSGHWSWINDTIAQNPP
ncbi:hypothetical protein WMF11_45425 [Sorangium sp. So ce295]|jgi:hypothetical protein|uniref:hypothetical protein n=1 Tax=Sorangium sp. So ce295 TaxID=3133295 RepID=UPI003F63FFE1